MLKHTNSRVAVGALDDDEKGVQVVYTLGGTQTVNFVNESGLYQLIFGSRLPQAKAFRRWVTRDVLPSVRKTGSYTSPRAEAASETEQPFQVDLPGHARYVVTAIPGQPAHVQQTDFDVILSGHSALDYQLMAYALKNITALWHKVQQFRSLGLREGEADMTVRLERTILDGSVVADDALRGLWLPAEGR